MNELITIFTPTYNRAQLLSKLYQSLCLQKNLDFIWLIIDDGSTDHTEETVAKWGGKLHFVFNTLNKKTAENM